ncbi:MAG TPA: histidine--tRNA ligase [bacterium]|nr:histidine--tRNA ligase [bacterium]
MSKKKVQKFYLVKGFKDILPEDQLYWEFVRAKFFNVAKSYGYDRIDLPILEDSKLFVKGVGNLTDVVSKEMFTFETLGNEKVSLRPEGTAGTVRAYIEHGMVNRKKPVKMFYIGPMFRYDKPQAGRYRQFYQFGLEVFAEDDPIIDSQMIYMTYQLFDELKIPVIIKINSIGCPKCREKFLKILKDYLKKNKSKLCKDCQIRYNKNILRILDCKEKKCREIVLEAPQILDHLCDDCNKHFVKVLEYLEDSQINYELDPFIVRGLDYYNRTTFEILPTEEFCEGDPGSQSALAGGGRYDYLVKNLGGQNTPAIGMAFGMDRIVNALKKVKNLELSNINTSDVFVAQLGDKARKKVLILFEKLRRAGFSVAESISKTSLGQQLEEANRLKTKLALIVGEKELLDKTVLIRDMESGNQEVVPENKIESVLELRLKSLDISVKKVRLHN